MFCLESCGSEGNILCLWTRQAITSLGLEGPSKKYFIHSLDVQTHETKMLTYLATPSSKTTCITFLPIQIFNCCSIIFSAFLGLVTKLLLIPSICLPSSLSFLNYLLFFISVGHVAGSAVRWATALQAGRSRVRFPMVSLKFFIDIILPAAL
jgi:hypothetical protein